MPMDNLAKIQARPLVKQGNARASVLMATRGKTAKMFQPQPQPKRRPPPPRPSPLLPLPPPLQPSHQSRHREGRQKGRRRPPASFQHHRPQQQRKQRQQRMLEMSPKLPPLHPPPQPRTRPERHGRGEGEGRVLPMKQQRCSTGLMPARVATCLRKRSRKDCQASTAAATAEMVTATQPAMLPPGRGWSAS